MTRPVLDGPTMWARWNAPFDDSRYQELVARERDRERQRLERIRARRRETFWLFVGLIVFLVVCASLWAGAPVRTQQPDGYTSPIRIDLNGKAIK